jgi:hypothetical protein
MKKFASLVMVIGLLALPACGKSKTNTLKYVPSNATLYFSIDNPYNWDSNKKEHVFSLIKSFGSANGAQSFDEWLDNLFQEDAAASGDISFSRDIKPWIGDSIAGYGLAHSSSRSTTDADVLLVPTKDEGKAKDFIPKLVKSSPGSFAEVKDGILFAADGESLCGGDCSTAEATTQATAAVKRSENLDSSNSLEEDSDFKALEEKVSSDKELFAYSNPKSSKTSSESAAASECLGGGLAGTSNRAALNASIEENAAKIDAATKSLRPESVSGKPTIMNGLPDDTVFAADGRGFGSSLSKVFKCLGQGSGSTSTEQAQLLQQYQNVLGLDFANDFSWIKGETVISVGDITAREVGLVADASDSQAAAQATAKKINDALVKSGLSSTEKSPGVYTAVVGAYLPDLTFGVKNNRFIVSTTSAYFDTLSAAASKPLSSSSAYKDFIDPNESVFSALFIQPDSIASSIGGFVSPETAKSLKQIDGVGFTVTKDGDYGLVNGSIDFTSST